MVGLRKIGVVLVDVYVWLFAKQIFYQFHNFLFKLSLKGIGVLNFRGDYISGEKYFVNTRLEKLLGVEPSIIFDVGANKGTYSKMLSERFPRSSIYSFEPNPFCIEYLENALPPSCKIFNFGLGECTEELILYDKAGASGSSHASLYKASLDDFHQHETVNVPVKIQKLDDFVEAIGINHIDFLKIDTEGHELEVLKGASNLIKHRKIRCIQFEFNSLHIYSRVFLHDFASFLSEYTLFRVLPRGLCKIDFQSVNSEIFAYQNIVCVLNRNLL